MAHLWYLNLKFLASDKWIKRCSMSMSLGSHEAVSSPQSHFIKSFTCHPPHSSQHRPAPGWQRGEKQQKLSELRLLLAPVRSVAGQTVWELSTAGHRWLTALKYHEQRQQPDLPTPTQQSQEHLNCLLRRNFKPTHRKLQPWRIDHRSFYIVLDLDILIY